MKILVIGGTHFIGKHIVLKLLERGHKVALFTRGRAQPEFWDDVEPILGNRKDYSGFRWKLARRSFDVVIDNIAYDRADVESAIQTFAGHIGHYLLCSSGAVYRDYSGWQQCRPFHEDDADLTFTGDFAYAEGKRAAELALWSIPEAQRPFPFTILRPTVVEGPEDSSGRTWFWVQRIADGQEVLVPQTIPTTIFRHAFVDDVAEAFVRAVTNPVAFNKVYNLAGEEILSLEDYVRAIAGALGGEAKIVLASLERIRQQPGLSEFQAPFSGERFIMDISKAKWELGYQPTPLEGWLRPTIAWFVNDYRGPDSDGYQRRTVEIVAAQRLRSA